ncbi:MAG: efflux transporter outer membrane subunit [Burkholderiaceae bacterium]|nr:efflux transporter outer membrane subunit [Burkholderiaceae bacterium]
MSDDCARTIGRLAAGVAVSLLLGACASMAPEYQRPAPPVSPAFPEAPPATADGALAADIQWQDFFADPRLKALVTVALDNNRDLRAAGLAIERARAQYRIRRADQLPTVNAAAIGQRQPGPTGEQSSLYTVGLAVTAFEFDFFGRIRSLSDAALAQYLATEEAQKSARISLIAAVANLYFNLLADDELLEVTQQALRTREESLKLTKLKFDNGAASELDFRQAEALYESARVTLAQVQRRRALDQNALVLLLGQPMPANLPPPQPLMSRQTLPDVPVGLPSDVLVRRPDVLAAEQELIAANASIGAARAAFWPRISLTTSAGVASTELSELFSDGKFAWTLNPQALLPIFDYGRNKANLRASEAARDIAVARYERAIQDAFREVADALAARSTLVDETRAQRAQVRAESARFRLADLRYRNGAASYLDVLDAQRSLFVAQQALVLVQAAQVQNLVTLYKVLGGGWK